MGEYVGVQRRIGHAIRVYARARGVKMKTLIEVLELSPPSFYERMSGKTKMTIEELCKVAEVLDVGVADLFELPPEYAPRDSNPEPADIGVESGMKVTALLSTIQAA